MNKLEEFNQSITSLQQEVQNLQAIDEAYKRLAKLVNDYDTMIANLNSSAKDMSNAKKELHSQSSMLTDNLDQLDKFIKTATDEHRKELTKKLAELKTLTETGNTDLHATLKSGVDEINEANRKFYNDFSNTVQTRLDNNKMEIKHLIDQDSQNSRQLILELQRDFHANIVNLSKQLTETQDALTKQFLVQKKINLAFGIVITVLVLIAICLGLLI